MTIPCDIILRASATPAQLTVLGRALWGWCNRAAGDRGVYQFLNSQVLADLIAGAFPHTDAAQAGRPDIRFRVRDGLSASRPASIASLRKNIPPQAVEDILVDGRSWNANAERSEPSN